MSCSDIFLGFIAILFPPIAVWIKSGLCSADSFINILLCMLGYVPGLLHAWYIIAKSPEHDYDRVDDTERQDRVTYYYVSHEPAGRRTRRDRPAHGYGTIPAIPGNKPTPQQPQQSGVIRSNNAPSGSQASGPSHSSVGASSSDQGAPPSYSEVVRGDHKIQTQD